MTQNQKALFDAISANDIILAKKILKKKHLVIDDKIKIFDHVINCRDLNYSDSFQEYNTARKELSKSHNEKLYSLPKEERMAAIDEYIDQLSILAKKLESTGCYDIGHLVADYYRPKTPKIDKKLLAALKAANKQTRKIMDKDKKEQEKKIRIKQKLENQNNKTFVLELCNHLKSEVNSFAEINWDLKKLEHTGDSRNKLVWKSIYNTMVKIVISQQYHSSHYVSKKHALDLVLLFGIILMGNPDKGDAMTYNTTGFS